MTSFLKTLTNARLRAFAPYTLHPAATFEGFYTKLTLPSGATLVVILTSVPRARNPARAHNISLVHAPAAGRQPWTAEVYAARARSVVREGAFTLEFLDRNDDVLARLRATPETLDLLVTLRASDLDAADGAARPQHAARADGVGGVHLCASARTAGPDAVPYPSPRAAGGSAFPGPGPGPEGWLALLPLPLHWHVHALSAPTSYTLRLPPHANAHPADTTPDPTTDPNAGPSSNNPTPPATPTLRARAHAEKNWAHSFPTAHIWLAAHDAASGSSLTLAGGRTLGQQAALAGVRIPRANVAVALRPPAAALGALRRLRIRADWAARAWEVDVRGAWTRVRVRVDAERGAGVAVLSAPVPGGFAGAGMGQVYDGRARVEVWARSGPGVLWGLLPFCGRERGWAFVAGCRFDGGVAAEMGGRYYGRELKAD